MIAKSVSPTFATVISPACSARWNAVRWAPVAAAKSPIRAAGEGFRDGRQRERHVRLRIASTDEAYWGRHGAYSHRHGGFITPLALADKSARANIRFSGEQGKSGRPWEAT